MSIFRALLFAIIAFINITCSISCSHECYAMKIENNLEIYAFNTGQANFIIMRHGNNAYIIDAGCDTKTTQASLDENMKKNVTSIINGSQLRMVFITHPHADHYNLLNAVLETFNAAQKQSTKYYLGGNLKHYPKDLSINSSETVDIFTQQHVQQFVDSDLTFRIIKSRVQADQRYKNTYSYMLLVTYNGKNILFGGDYILKKDLVSTLGLQKLDVVFLPHHGSVRTNSTELVKDNGKDCEIIDGDSITELTKTSLYFVCGGNSGNVKNTECFYELEPKRSTTVHHDISMNSPTKGRLCTQADNQTTRPLFTTQNASLGFYGIRINTDGSIEMYGINGNTWWETPFKNSHNNDQTILQKDLPLVKKKQSLSNEFARQTTLTTRPRQISLTQNDVSTDISTN